MNNLVKKALPKYLYLQIKFLSTIFIYLSNYLIFTHQRDSFHSRVYTGELCVRLWRQSGTSLYHGRTFLTKFWMFWWGRELIPSCCEWTLALNLCNSGWSCKLWVLRYSFNAPQEESAIPLLPGVCFAINPFSQKIIASCTDAGNGPFTHKILSSQIESAISKARPAYRTCDRSTLCFCCRVGALALRYWNAPRQLSIRISDCLDLSTCLDKLSSPSWAPVTF